MTTLVTAAQIAQVRRMVAEPLAATYTDALLVGFIEKYPLLDTLGEEPFLWIAGVPPTSTINTEWIPTYDLNAAAADIWDEKAATVAANYDFSADGGTYNRKQQFDMYSQQGRHYRSRRVIRTIRMVQSPEEPGADAIAIVNVNNPYE